MKTVLVVGFYDPVKRLLDERYARHLNDRIVIWIRQIAPNREANLSELAQLFFGRLRIGSTHILVLLGVPRRALWVVSAVQGMIQRGQELHPNVEFTLRSFDNLGDSKGVEDAILSFEPLDTGEISVEQLRSKIGEGRVLCVSLDGKTQIGDALRRRGFTEEALQMYFTEERIVGAKNSNLMEMLNGRSKQYSHLLYAWDGLRTLKPSIKNKFGLCYEAPTAALVVEIFRKWILSDGV